MLANTDYNEISGESGNTLYRFAIPLDCEDQVVLTEEWASQEALDIHQKGEAIADLRMLKEKYEIESIIQLFDAERR